MRFTEWLHIRESEQVVTTPTPEAPEVELPDARQVIYTAAVLHKNSQDQLAALAQKLMTEATGGSVPRGWIGRAHHMTIKFRPRQGDIEALKTWIGDKDGVNLLVTDWAYDDYGIAVVVQPGPLPVTNSAPHVTVGHSREVDAVYSNSLLADKSKWKPLHEGSLSLRAYVVGVGSRDSIFPDMSPIPLAAPSFTF